MSKEFDDLAAAYVAALDDVRQSAANTLYGLNRDFQQAFNANDPAKAGPIAQKIADLASAYAALAVKDAEAKAAADAQAAEAANVL